MKYIPKESLIIRPSMAMFYGDGEIWFEQLDALSIHKDIVIDKMKQDMIHIAKPSTPSLIAVNLNETLVDHELSELIIQQFCIAERYIQKIAFVGLDKQGKALIKQALKHTAVPFHVSVFFENDYEKAKEYLIRRKSFL